jgi:hypothetical protein
MLLIYRSQQFFLVDFASQLVEIDQLIQLLDAGVVEHIAAEQSRGVLTQPGISATSRGAGNGRPANQLRP